MADCFKLQTFSPGPGGHAGNSTFHSANQNTNFGWKTKNQFHDKQTSG